jgi:hypothetical protein
MRVADSRRALAYLMSKLRAYCFCLLSAISACDDYRDTCTGGDNMSNPRINEGVDLTVQRPELRLTWERGTGVGATLPDSYFDWVSVSKMDGNGEVIQSVKHSAPREILIELAPATLIRHLEKSSELNLTLLFPDRRLAIPCTHPASADMYIVNITLEVQEGVLWRATVEQSVYLGPF